MTRKEAKNKIRMAFNYWIKQFSPFMNTNDDIHYTEFMQEVNAILKEFEKSIRDDNSISK